MKSRFCVICHYSEIALKGKNRRFFEKQLVFNIREKLKAVDVSSPHGKIVIFTEGSKEKIEDALKKTPGIEYFFFSNTVISNIKKIREEVLLLLEKESFDSFRFTVKRSDKSFKMTSMEVASFLGGEVIKKMKKRVDLHKPDLNCFIEIDKKETYIYFKKIKGLGGLPVGSSGKMVSLLSGGIDSPVASLKMMERGAKCIFVHFHTYPSTSKQSIEKVKRVAERLSEFQGESVLYLVSFDEAQKKIMISTKEKMRVLLYRRFMMRIAAEILKREKAKAFITGESLGQVASQTVDNIAVIQEATDVLILRPLIGSSKEEIINIARKIGSYNISILPEDDCCVRFLPKKPETKGRVKEIREEEKSLDVNEIVKEAVGGVERVVISKKGK